MSKIDELLAVPDIPEREQLLFLESYPDKTIDGFKVLIEGRWRLPKNYLPALAFRLRDEAISKDSDLWAQACWYVQQWISFQEIKEWKIPSFEGLNNAEHEILTKEAIVWIIAALIAERLARKELTNGNRN